MKKVYNFLLFTVLFCVDLYSLYRFWVWKIGIETRWKRCTIRIEDETTTSNRFVICCFDNIFWGFFLNNAFFPLNWLVVLVLFQVLIQNLKFYTVLECKNWFYLWVWKLNTLELFVVVDFCRLQRWRLMLGRRMHERF